MIRVLVDGLHEDLEGDVIGGEMLDEDRNVDLGGVFTVRSDDGHLFSVHGWMVDVTVLSTKPDVIQ